MEKEIAITTDKNELAIEELKKVFGKGSNTVATDEEWAMFAGLCRTTGLNPFTREIWLVPYQTNNGYRQTLIMVGIAGLRRIANEHIMYDGLETEITLDPLDKKKPYSGKCKVFRKDRTRPETVELFFSEVARKDHSGTGSWSTAPCRQFTKCLEAAALRKAFPILSSVYIPEETGYNEKTGDFIEVVSETPQKKLERKLSEWSGAAPEIIKEIPVEQEEETTEPIQTKTEHAPRSWIYTIEKMEADKAKAIKAYAEKCGASVVFTKDDGLSIVSSRPLPKLNSYEVEA
jgi:phage recombination protein Bet